jgi:acetylornithine deacetylase
MGRLLAWVDALAKERSSIAATDAYAAFPDPVPVQVLAVEANGLGPDVPLSVPSQATVRVYFQFLPEEDVDAVIQGIQSSLRKFESSDPFFRAHPMQWRPPIGSPLLGTSLPANHAWTQCLAKSAKVATGRQPAITGAPYPCDAGLIQREFGIPTLLYGPCGAGAHNPGEYVEFESVLVAAEVLLTAALQWTSA